MEVARRYCCASSQSKPTEEGHFRMEKWESEKPKSWGMPVEGFKGHVATDGSFLGTDGKCGACGWSVVQLEFDEELGLLHGMYGSIDGMGGVTLPAWANFSPRRSYK